MGNRSSFGPFDGKDKKDIYADIYRDANPIGRLPVSTAGSGKIVTVARMYIRLEEVESLLASAGDGGEEEGIEEMYIFADVVEVEGDKLGEKWPAKERRRYVLVCNLLLLDLSARDLLVNLIYEEAGWDVSGSAFNLSPSLLVTSPVPDDELIPATAQFILIHCNHNFLYDRHSNNLWPEQSKRPSFWVDRPDAWPPRWILQHPSLLLGMESTVATSELILHHTPPDSHDPRLLEAITAHARWLNQMLAATLNTPSEQPDGMAGHELRMLLFRVQSLLRWPPGKLFIQVPRLHYARFGNLIDRMAGVAEVYDRDFKHLKLFIAQNKATGAYLLEQNMALAEREQDMELAQSALYSMKEADLRKAVVSLETLTEQLQEMNGEMEQARQDMEAGLRKFRDRQVARAVFSIFRAVAAIGLAVFTGGATAKVAVTGAKAAADGVMEAVGMAQRLHKLIKTVEQMLNVVEVIWELHALLEGLIDMEVSLQGGELPDLPSVADWHIFENEVEAIAAGMPEEVSEVVVWKTQCKNVAVLGRAVTTQAVAVHDLRYDVETHRLMAAVSGAHAERLLSLGLGLDIADYQRLATEMDLRTTRITLALFKALSMRNAAMLYEYLLPVTPLQVSSAADLTISNVRSLLVHQEATAVAALNDLGIPTVQSATYTMQDIPVQVLLEGEPWEFEIPIASSAEFPGHWRRVRISHLEIRFTGSHLPATSTGKLYCLLQAGGTFFDRARLPEEPLEYEAIVPVTYQHSYDLSSGNTLLSNQAAPEFANHFMRMTPFTTWRLRLPPSALENRGLSFPTATSSREKGTVFPNATTQVSISFYLTIIRSIDEYATLFMTSKDGKRRGSALIEQSSID